MSHVITASAERARRCALLNLSLRMPLLLADGRRVHLAGVGQERACLWPLLNEYADLHGRYTYDHTERIEADWETVEEVLNGTGVLEPHQVTREPGLWMQVQEQHAFGYSAEGNLWRFGGVIDHATFCRVTHSAGLPPRWLAWHQGTTSHWPHALDTYPLLTRRDWQRLTGQQEAGDPASPQDPVPLLERFATRQQAGKMLRVLPCTLAEANAYVKGHHRHNRPVVGGQYALCVTDSAGQVRGVAILGRPVARMLDSGKEGEMKRRILEVLRVATDGTGNACSMLYGAARRLAKEAGYEKIITYTLASEPGTTLLAAGWQKAACVKGRQWTWTGRTRQARPIFAEDKYRWESLLAAPRSFGQIVFAEREDEVGQQQQERRDGRRA